MDNDDDETDEFQPPAPERVCRRALVLAAVSCRASLEEEPQHPVSVETHRRLRNWFRADVVRQEFEESEWSALITPLGELTERQTIDLSWRSEGLVVLAWALHRSELPPHDQQVDGPAIGDAIGFLADDGPTDLLNQAELRHNDELWWLADLTLAVHWRLRQYSLHPDPMDFVEFVSRCEWAHMPIDDLPLVENDLAIRGSPISAATKPLFRECLSIARERQQAANWLVGTETVYSEVTCDT